MPGRARPSADRCGDRLEFETLISDTSASLFTASPEQVDRAIERALEGVRDFFRADRCALLVVGVDQQVVTVRLRPTLSLGREASDNGLHVIYDHLSRAGRRDSAFRRPRIRPPRRSCADARART